MPIVQNQRFFNKFVDAIYIRTNHVSDINISSAIFTFVSFEAIFYVNVILQKKQKKSNNEFSITDRTTSSPERRLMGSKS